MEIRPVADKRVTSTNGFTLGRAGRLGRLLTVVNDNGHTRHVSLGCPSPHLVVADDSYLGQHVAGYFEEVK